MWGDDFHKKFQILEKKIPFWFIFFKCYYCSINLNRQSEHSGLRPDTSILVVILASTILLPSCVTYQHFCKTKTNSTPQPNHFSLFFVSLLEIIKWNCEFYLASKNFFPALFLLDHHRYLEKFVKFSFRLLFSNRN